MSDNRNDLPAPSAPNFNQRLRETVQTFLGRQGNPLDRVLTLRDLVDIGMLKLRSGFQLKPGAGSSVPLEPGDGVVDTYEPDLTPPPTPGSMTVTASISHVMIEHEAPVYRQGHGHLRTRVYGKVVKAGDPLPVFADAIEIGQFSGTVYAQPSNPATTWRLWTKWETVDGVLSVGPAGGINGLEAVTGRDVAKLVAAMTGPGNPFKVVTESITLPDGTVVPAGTYTADAYIHNGQIVNAKIGNLAVDDGKIANLSVSKLTAGTLSVGQWIASANYIGGVSGWAINANGTAEFGSASIRGQLAASQIDTEGLTIKHEGLVILGAGSSLPAQFVTPDGGWLNSNLVPSINDAATTSSWGGVYGAGKPADGATSGSNLIKKGTFDDGLPGSWGYAGIENRINAGMPYAKNIYFHARDNIENGADFDVTPGEILYGSAWLETRSISSYACYLGVRIVDASGAVIGWNTICGIGPDTSWTYVKGSTVVPVGGVRAVPWVTLDGYDFPANYQWLRAAGLYIGRHEQGATVGAPSGTYVGNTPAQDVESQSGAQGKADIARAGAIGVASEDASSKANWARNAAVDDVTPSINAKLSKAGDIISGRISFAVSDGMFAGSDTNNGVYFGKDGLVGRKSGANTFYIDAGGNAVFSGTLDAATMNSGRINLQHSGDWDWGYARSYNKWWDDEQNGWVLARHADGSTFMEMRGGSNRIWMSSWDDCGIEFPGISMTNGGLTISQANVIDTLQLAGNSVTVSSQASGTAQSVSTTLTIPPNTTMAITAVASIGSFVSEDTAFNNWAVPQISVSIDGVGISDTHQYQIASQGETWTDYTIYATSISYGKSVTNSSESPVSVVVAVTGSTESVGASKSITAFGFKR